jgi:type II secretory pathway component PulF
MNGQVSRGHIYGVSSNNVRQLLNSRKIETISLRRLWLPRRQNKELILFFLHLRYALSAGHPLIQAMDMIHPSFKGSFSMLLHTLREHVSQGKLLSDACQLYPWTFPGPLIALLHVGEQSGRLGVACQQAHEYLKKMENTHKNFRKVLAYPILNGLFFIGALLSLSHGLLPNINTISDSNGGSISWSTQCLVAINQGHFSLTLYASIFGILVFFMWSRPLLFPFLGSLVARKTYALFFSGIVLLLKADVSLTQSLNLMGQNIYHRGVFPEIIAKILREIQEGHTLTQSVSHLPYFSNMYLQFLKAGESTGQLIHSLELLTEFIHDDVNKTVDRWLFWITPCSLVFIGLCFWVLIEGAISPLYENIEQSLREFYL